MHLINLIVNYLYRKYGVPMVAELCHFVISFCRCEIKIIFVISGRSRKEEKTQSFRYFGANSKKRKIASFRYFGAKSKRRKDANLRLFVISSFRPEIRKYVVYRYFVATLLRNKEKTKRRKINKMVQISHHTNWIGLGVCVIPSQMLNEPIVIRLKRSVKMSWIAVNSV